MSLKRDELKNRIEERLRMMPRNSLIKTVTNLSIVAESHSWYAYSCLVLRLFHYSFTVTAVATTMINDRTSDLWHVDVDRQRASNWVHECTLMLSSDIDAALVQFILR